MLQGTRGGDAVTKDVNAPSRGDHAGSLILALFFQDAAEASAPVAYARAKLNSTALAEKTARDEQGMSKQSRTTELSDFAVETEFGKDGAKLVYAISRLSSCNTTRLTTGVHDDNEYVAGRQNVMMSRIRVVENTLRCAREHQLAHLTEHSKA